MIECIRSNVGRHERRTCGYQLLAACALVLSFTLGVGHAADEPVADSQGQQSGEEFSPANHLLFMTDHLANVTPPTELKYSLTRTGDPNNNFDDHLDLKVERGTGDAKMVAVDFLSGDRHRYVPDVSNAHGNPAVMMFLQNDVVEMAQRTGGSWRYFQRRIKLALQNSANITNASATFDGHTVQTREVTIHPFADAKSHSDDIANEMDKRYVFTLSDEVPGGLLEIRSEVPSGRQDQQPIVERLMLSSVTTGKTSAPPGQPST